MPSITQQLLDDNAFDLENWLITELGDAFGDAEADAFMRGTGVGQASAASSAEAHLTTLVCIQTAL